MFWGPIGIGAYDGARTPLYPLFLTALQHVFSGRCLVEPRHGVLDLISGVQLLLYLGSTVYLYRALGDLGIVVRLVGMAAIAFSPLHALFARQILTEALAAPLVLLFMAHLLRFALRGRSERDATLSFVLFTLLVLTRPNVLVPLAPAVAFVLGFGAQRKRLLGRAALAVGLPLLVAMSLNFANRRHFKLTNFDGYASTQVVYNLFDRVHEEDSVLGSILSRQHRTDLGTGQASGDVRTGCPTGSEGPRGPGPRTSTPTWARCPAT
jgi:4-amino-4-deoxy-L-arabinose transferase-like glycosyltransferase